MKYFPNSRRCYPNGVWPVNSLKRLLKSNLVIPSPSIQVICYLTQGLNLSKLLQKTGKLTTA